MKNSKMVEAITPSLTRKLFNMANEIGEDVINLTLGDPDLLPPKEIREAACKAIMLGKTRYSANAGLIDLRKTYASFFQKQYGCKILPEKNIIATVGGMEALFLSLASIVDKDDEVIIFSPYYVNYFQMINMFAGKPIIIDVFGKSDKEIGKLVKNAITINTKAIIINTPCNPTGEILSGHLISTLADIAIENDLYVISDEVYSSLIYDDNNFESIYTKPGMAQRTILIDSCSKRFAMTGWRIGFAVGPEEIISNMTKMQENVAACAPLSSQYGAIKAYGDDIDYSYIKETYQHRRDIIYNAIKNSRWMSCHKPQATFYCFVDISKTGLDSEKFAYSLLQRKHVAVVPGVAYGKAYSNHIRIAFTLDDNLLLEAMKRMNEFCEEVGN